MSGMSRNPYAEELEGYVDPRNSLEASAILALAYEQRTANLIAFEQAQWAAWTRDELTKDGVALWHRAADQIVERLDLS